MYTRANVGISPYGCTENHFTNKNPGVSIQKPRVSLFRLLAAEFLGHFHDMLSGQTELLQQVIGGAGITEHIIDADALDGSGLLLGQDGADCFAQTAQIGRASCRERVCLSV